MRKTIRRNRCGPYRRYGFTALRIVLGALAAVMLFLAGAAVVRSVRTARLNSRLSELHDASGEETDPQNSQTHNLPEAGTAVQAPTRGKITGRPSLMGYPDGSAIREYGKTAPLSSPRLFHVAAQGGHGVAYSGKTCRAYAGQILSHLNLAQPQTFRNLCG